MIKRLNRSTNNILKFLLVIAFLRYGVFAYSKFGQGVTITAGIFLLLGFVLFGIVVYINLNSLIVEYDDTFLYCRRLYSKKVKRIPLKNLIEIQQKFPGPRQEFFRMLETYKIIYADNSSHEFIEFDCGLSWGKADKLDEFINVVQKENAEFKSM